MQWAVSQAVPFRRMHVQGSMCCIKTAAGPAGDGCQTRWWTETWARGRSSSGSAATANGEAGLAANWNMVFVGVAHAPEGEWPKPPYTKVAETPVVREKPFLAVDAEGRYSVRVTFAGARFRRNHVAKRLDAWEVDPSGAVFILRTLARIRRGRSMRNWMRGRICC